MSNETHMCRIYNTCVVLLNVINLLSKCKETKYRVSYTLYIYIPIYKYSIYKYEIKYIQIHESRVQIIIYPTIRKYIILENNDFCMNWMKFHQIL